MITSHVTIDPVFSRAMETIIFTRKTISSEQNKNALQKAVWAFEDTLNGMSGKIASLPHDVQRTIQTACHQIVAMAAYRHGITVSLHSSLVLLPQSTKTTENQRYVTAKQLYPQTTSVPYQVRANATVVTIVANVVPLITSSNVTDNLTNSTETEFTDIIDPLFVAQDKQSDMVTETPQALIQVPENTVKILPDDLVDIALSAAADSNGLQAGLTNISVNPLAHIIGDTGNLILHYTANNFANLNVSLGGIQSDANLESEYITLLEAIGGRDGLSGSVSQLNDFRMHTDRLSGLVLDEDSTNAEPDDDSKEEFLEINNVSGNLNQIIVYSANKFRTARYWIQATAGRKHQATELYIVHDNKFVYTREVGTVYTQDPFLSFTSQLVDSNIKVLANTSLPNTDFVIYGLRLKIARASQSYSDMSQAKIIQNHEGLASYTGNGIDYVAIQSASLAKEGLVGNLALVLRDLIADLSSEFFLAQTTGTKATKIIYWANAINTHNTNLQAAIDLDHDNFRKVGKMLEALEIVYTLTTGYQDIDIKDTLVSTLNNEVKTILDEQELDEDEEED